MTLDSFSCEGIGRNVVGDDGAFATAPQQGVPSSELLNRLFVEIFPYIRSRDYECETRRKGVGVVRRGVRIDTIANIRKLNTKTFSIAVLDSPSRLFRGVT